MHSAGATHYSVSTRTQRKPLVAAGDRGDNPVQPENIASASPRDARDHRPTPQGSAFFCLRGRRVNFWECLFCFRFVDTNGSYPSITLALVFGIDKTHQKKLM
jgi:hypothetical protein